MSTIIAANISDGTTSVASTYVVNGSAKAWVGLSEGSIEDSTNLTSMTDNGTGDYTSNFTNAMSNATYAFSAYFFFEGTGSSYGYVSQNADRATGSIRNYGRRNASAILSDTQGCVTIHGDLA